MTQGRLAVLTAYGEPFDVREYPVPDPGPGRDGRQGHPVGHLRLGPAHVAPGLARASRSRPAAGPWATRAPARCSASARGSPPTSSGTPLAEGDRVIHSVIVGCHRCHLCLRGEENLCLNKTVTPPAGHVPLLRRHVRRLLLRAAAGMPVFKVPDELRDDVLAPVNCAMGTATQALLSAGLRPGRLRRRAGGRRPGAHRHRHGQGHGRRQGDRVRPPRCPARGGPGVRRRPHHQRRGVPDRRTSGSRSSRSSPRGRGADIVLEFVGLADLLPEGVAMLRRGGTYVDVGLFFPGRTVSFDPSTIVMSGKKIMGSAMYRPIVLSHDPRLPRAQPGPAAVREARLPPLPARRHQRRLRPVRVGRPADAGRPRRARALSRSLHGDQPRHRRHRR